MKSVIAIFFVASFFTTFQAQARLTDAAVLSEVSNRQVLLTTIKGFHFNADAPSSVTFDQVETKSQPTIKTEPKIVFDVPAGAKIAKLNYYVCDDKKTVCEMHRKELSVDKDAKKAAVVLKKDEISSAQQHLRVVGFESDRPTLLIFSAPWCPACIRMKTETYTENTVKNLFNKMNVKTMNIDLVENENLSKQFAVRAIPTLILLNKEGKEVYRWLDYQPSSTFATILKQEMQNSTSLAQLKDKALAGDMAAATKLGENAYSQMKWEDAIQWLALAKEEKYKNLKLSAEVNLASDQKDLDSKKIPEYLKVLDKAFALSTSRIDQARWKVDYLEGLKEQKQPIDAVAIKNLNQELANIKNDKNIDRLFKDSTYGDVSSFEKIETLDLILRSANVASDEAATKAAQAEMAEILSLRSDYSVKQPGKLISVIYYFSQAGDVKSAEVWSKKLVTKYPKTYVYYDRYGKFLLKQKRYDEALEQIDLALKYKEGNEPQLNMTKIKILKALKKNEEALKLANQTMTMIEPHPEKYQRTKIALVSLQEELTKK